MSGISRFIVGSFLFAVLFASSGCIHDVILYFKSQSQVDSTAVAQYWDGPRVGAGMAIDVTVGTATTPPKDFKLLVDQNGDLTIPYLLDKPISCDGLTIEALKGKITKAYSVYLRQPQVLVNFGAYDQHGVSPYGTVTVMGEVANPGPVNMPPTRDLTVTKVLQLAGGVKPFADKTSVRVTRCDKEGRQTKHTVDLEEIGKNGRFDLDMVLKAGDVVYVPETMF